MNPWLSIASLIIAVFGVGLAIIFYIKGKRVKLPFYADRSVNIVKDLVSRFESLEMLYSGQPIENLTVTKTAFWNGGRDTIKGGDVASADPLSVHVKKGCKILDAKILYTKNPANQFSITTSDDQSYITLQFDYVDKGEGVVIQLIHTCTSSEDIKIRGTIKGAGKPVHRYVPTSSTKRFRYIIAILYFSIPPILMAYLFLAKFFAKPENPLTLIVNVVVLASIFIGYSWLGFNTLKKRVPKGFDVFQEKL